MGQGLEQAWPSVPPFWWPPVPSPFSGFSSLPESAREPRGSASSGSTSNSRARTRAVQEPDSEDNQEENLQDNEDTINLLEDAEALELVEFDPSFAPKNSWEAPKAFTEFLNKHFNRAS